MAWRHARIFPVALAVALTLGCQAGEKIDSTKWRDLEKHARPTILKDMRGPDKHFLSWKKQQEKREADEKARLAKQPKVNASFVDLTIRDALLEISDQAKIPVVPDQSVTGNVTLNLEKVPFEVALRLIAFAGNYSYATDGFAYYVGTPDPTSPTYAMLTTTRVIPTHQPPKRIATALNKSYSPYLSYAEDGNYITVTGPPGILERIEADIQLLDRVPLQIQIEVLIVETKIGDDLKAGVDWGKLTSSLEHKFVAGKRLETAGNVDQYSLITDVAATFEILEDKKVAKIRSHPKIVTTNGQPAEIRSLVESYVVITQQGVAVLTADLEIIKSGTTLKVTPRVTRNGEIEMTLEPEVADVVGITGEANNSLPVISRRGVKSTVRVKNGDVVVIGGLYEKSMSAIKSGIPFLKHIPVFDILTSHRDNKASETELLIFVSPKIIQ